MEQILRTLADAFSAVGPGLTITRSRGPADVWGLDVADARLEIWHEHYADRLQAATKRHCLAGSFVVSEVCWVPEWAEFRQDWVAPQGFSDLMEGQLMDGDAFYGLGVFREPGQPNFGGSDLKLMSSLLPHIGRALQLRERLAPIFDARDLATMALDSLGIGFVFLDTQAQIIEANGRAQRILDAKDGISIVEKTLTVADTVIGGQLARILGELNRDVSHPGGLLRVDRPSRARPYELLAMRLPRGRFQIGSRSATIVVFLTDPDEATAPTESALIELYSLTGAEAHIAAELAGGHSPAEIAKSRGISPQTVRNQLKSIFGKTGTTGQVQLVQRLLSGIARLRGG